MTSTQRIGVRELLLAQRGVAFVEPSGTPAQDEPLQAAELELAEVGYVLSSRLRERLAHCSIEQLVEFRAWALATLLQKLGGAHAHTPLFRRFPEGIPPDTLDLWWRKVLVHFAQAPGQPCLSCRRVGTTHVLSCGHVVCDHCFDGSNYSACPICEHHVGPSSFFKPTSPISASATRTIFKLIDLGTTLSDEARALFSSLCARKQALSPDDRQTLVALVELFPSDVLSWLPPEIPVRENVALVFGTLAQRGDPLEIVERAKPFMTTATDVLRFIAVLSGTDGSLQREPRALELERSEMSGRFLGATATALSPTPLHPTRNTLLVRVQVSRFKTAKLSRPLRRALLGVLESMSEARLTEDMLRHRSFWVWVGEFLHPHEYEKRFPRVARAFRVVRKQAPDGTVAPAFHGWNGQLERATQARDVERALALLTDRPGELARRLDHILRISTTDAERARVVGTFTAKVSAMGTPVLVNLRSHLSQRDQKARIRVYWPKGKLARCVNSADERVVLSRSAIEPAIAAIEAELLLRFSQKQPFAVCVIDEALRTVTVPFNERTASKSAVSLPRGTRVTLSISHVLRLFLHWCEPQKNGHETDLDLSVGLFDAVWRQVGVCSYYQLQSTLEDGTLIAQSAGDLRDAPWPDGASEFVDVHTAAARVAGARYAVMVVNAYAGMPFSQLERAFAGLMLSESPLARHFDPKAVELKFDLAGENGIYLPLVVDLHQGVLHWLDVQSKGKLQLNNVATSKATIAKVCPELMAYFESGTRTSMFELGLLHAAARSARVVLRGETLSEFEREPGESIAAFYRRLRTRADGNLVQQALGNTSQPALALLFRGDLDLPNGSAVYALFRDRVVPTLSASDLLS
ncbi:MAG TPA: MXAN_6230/SCO0854 family RING domain-containing protein [Polyangiaceae bacterium]|nr:MXAN_6230/SCO0854 family RING domain-containing protein [Polyangiaceae bacterium]